MSSSRNRDSDVLLQAVRETIEAQISSAERIGRDLAVFVTAAERIKSSGEPGAEALVERLAQVITDATKSPHPAAFDDEKWTDMTRSLRSVLSPVRRFAKDRLDGVRDKTRRALEERQRAVREIERIIEADSTPPSLRSAFGLETMNDPVLMKASSTVRVLRRCADRALGETEGVPFFGWSSGDDTALVLKSGGTAATLKLHEKIARGNAKAITFLTNAARERTLSEAWLQLLAKQPAFARVVKRVSSPSEERSLMTSAKTASDQSIASVVQRARQAWNADYHDCIVDAQAGGNSAFLAMRRVETRATFVTEELHGTPLMKEIASAVSASLGLPHPDPSIRASDIEACREAFIELVLDPATDPSVVGALADSPVWLWLESIDAARDVLSRAAQSSVPDWVVLAAKELPCVVSPLIGSSEGKDIGDELDEAQKAAAKRESAADENAASRLEEMREALREIFEVDPGAGVLFEGLSGKKLRAENNVASVWHRAESRYVAVETPLEGLIFWTLSGVSLQWRDGEVSRLAYGSPRPDRTDLNNRMTQCRFDDDVDAQRADVRYLRGLGDEDVHRFTGITRLYALAEAEFLDAIREGPAQALERRLALALAETNVSARTLKTIGRSALCPAVVARMVEEDVRVPDVLRKSFVTGVHQKQGETKRAVDRILTKIDFLQTRLGDEESRLADVGAAFERALHSAGVDGDVREKGTWGSYLGQMHMCRALSHTRRVVEMRELFGTLSEVSDVAAGDGNDDRSADKGVSNVLAPASALEEVDGVASRLRSAIEARQALVTAIAVLDGAVPASQLRARFVDAYAENRPDRDDVVLHALDSQQDKHGSERVMVRTPGAPDERDHFDVTPRRPPRRRARLDLTSRPESQPDRADGSMPPSLLARNAGLDDVTNPMFDDRSETGVETGAPDMSLEDPGDAGTDGLSNSL